jgi:hypothetical protein
MLADIAAKRRQSIAVGRRIAAPTEADAPKRLTTQW